VIKRTEKTSQLKSKENKAREPNKECQRLKVRADQNASQPDSSKRENTKEADRVVSSVKRMLIQKVWT